MYTEFISVEGLIRDATKSVQKLDIYDEERPIGIQIFGAEIESMGRAAEIVEEARPELLEINFGCPVKKVVCKMAGAGILQDIPKMSVWERNPAGVESTTSLEFPDQPDGGLFATMIRKVVGNLPESRSYSDPHGRVVLQHSTGFGGRSVLVESAYDSLGRRTKTSLPHFEGTTARWTEYSYDAVDRVIRERRPDGSESLVEHLGLVAAQTDANGTRTTRKVDSSGASRADRRPTRWVDLVSL